MDLERLQIIVRQGKGNKDRATLLSVRLVDPLTKVIDDRHVVHGRDLAAGEGWVELPLSSHRRR